MRDHRKLKVFAEADGFALAVYRATAAFPKHELFGLTAQMRRAAVSIVSNIVEGCSRKSQADYLRFMEIAYGSAVEAEYQLSLALRLGYLPAGARDPLSDSANKTARMLNALLGAYAP